MSYLNREVEELAAKLGWSVRANTDNPAEVIVGDYARGFVIMDLDGEIQVAQRPLRGEPSLKLRTNDREAAQQYIVFYAARLLRFREGLGDVDIAVDAALISEPFALRSTPFECTLSWGESWIDFGAGNDFAAAQFVQYRRDSIAEEIAALTC